MSDSSVPPWIVALQSPLSVEFPSQEYWSGLPFPSPEDLSNLRIEPTSPASQEDSLPLSHWESPLGPVSNVLSPPSDTLYFSECYLMLRALSTPGIPLTWHPRLPGGSAPRLSTPDNISGELAWLSPFCTGGLSLGEGLV